MFHALEKTKEEPGSIEDIRRELRNTIEEISEEDFHSEIYYP